jgi:hypothetical protein
LPDDLGTVFISYTHDSPNHLRAVFVLSERFRSEGINCVLDQYEISPPEGWPLWMDREIVKAQFVLMVCTEAYYRRVMGQEKPGEGLGIAWEGTLIYNQIYRAASRNEKFIPIIFEKTHDIYIPTPLQGATRYFIPADYERLYKRLIGESPGKPLGKRKPLPQGEVKTDFSGVSSRPRMPYLGAALASGETGLPWSQLTSATPPLEGSTTASSWVPLWHIIERIASAVGDSREPEHYARTRLCIRQAALDGRLRIRGRHEIERPGQDRTIFSDVHTEIPSAYWKNSVINVLATGALFEADRQTGPETVYAWGLKGLYETNCYAGLQLHSDDVSQLWPLKT